MQVTDEMVSRFLCWPLPKTFSPDCGIDFKRFHPNGVTPYEPVGTNLLTAVEARAMLEHVLAAASPAPAQHDFADTEHGYQCKFCGQILGDEDDPNFCRAASPTAVAAVPPVDALDALIECFERAMHESIAKHRSAVLHAPSPATPAGQQPPTQPLRGWHDVTTYACPEKDIDCGRHESNWCKTCPLRYGATQLPAPGTPAGQQPVRCNRCGRYEDGSRCCPNGDSKCPITPPPQETPT